MKKFELSIPKPCHEAWEAMTPEAKGRFCGSCQKTVIDFSSMGDAQIAQFFKKPVGFVCGRFDGGQLNRVVEVPRKRLPWIKYFFTIALPAFLFSKKAAAQGEVVRKVGRADVCYKPVKGDTATKVKPSTPFTEVTLPKETVFGRVFTKLKLVETKTFKGQIVNDKGEPVPFATVAANDEGRIVAADSMGRFSIKHTSFPLRIEITSVGYVRKEVVVNDERNPTVILQTAGYPEGTLGLVMVTSVRKKTPKSFAQPQKIEAQKAQTSTAKFLVYPNPVSANSSFTLDAKDLESGAYTMQLFTVAGDAVQVKELAIEKKCRQSIPLGDVAAGTYVIRLTDKKTAKASSEVILVR